MKEEGYETSVSRFSFFSFFPLIRIIPMSTSSRPKDLAPQISPHFRLRAKEVYSRYSTPRPNSRRESRFQLHTINFIQASVSHSCRYQQTVIPGHRCEQIIRNRSNDIRRKGRLDVRSHMSHNTVSASIKGTARTVFESIIRARREELLADRVGNCRHCHHHQEKE